MSRSTRWIVILAAVAAAIVLFLLLRPGGEPTVNDTASPSPTSSPTTGTPTGTPTTTPTTTPSVDFVEIEVEDGEVRGPQTITVALGERVRFEVQADVSDEVHVHTYDLLKDVTPDRPARFNFVADIPGVFEVELESAGLLLFRLEVTA